MQMIMHSQGQHAKYKIFGAIHFQLFHENNYKHAKQLK